MKVLAAMSGGVDSAVAAARAVDSGHDVTGVHMALSRTPAATRAGARGCCTIEDANDASRAADVIGIPFYVWDMSQDFADRVIVDFIAEYAAGRTPNPCVRCNEHIKFAALLERAMALGFDAVCTGHYAQVIDGQLFRAVDGAKDQSYVLAVLDREQISHSLFPLGNSTKEQVRKEAAERGLRVADKPDSHDICFIPDGDTVGWLAQRVPGTQGQVLDAESGQQVGTHQGAHAFTVGQRRGLALGNPTGEGERRYVIETDIKANTVTIGPPTLLDVRTIYASHMRWAGEVPESGAHVGVQVRAHGEELPAHIDVFAQSVVVHLDTPLRGLAAGQTVALYDGTRVIGSATVDKTART